MKERPLVFQDIIDIRVAAAVNIHKHKFRKELKELIHVALSFRGTLRIHSTHNSW